MAACVAVVNPDAGRTLRVSDGAGVALPDSLDPGASVPPVVFAGEFRLVDYAAPERRIVHLVGLDSATLATAGGSTAAGLERELNAIYAGAQVEWTVVADPPLTVAEVRAVDAEFTGRFAATESAALSAYTGEMRGVRKALKRRAGGIKKGELYLVLAPALGGERLGFMPRGKAFGFVDVPRHGGDAAGLVRTIAHELGHGAFRFEHLDVRFKPDGYVGGATDNLMDGGAGRHLGKWQWDNAHDPEFNVAIFDDETEGESYSPILADKVVRLISDLACAAASTDGSSVDFSREGRAPTGSNYSASGPADHRPLVTLDGITVIADLKACGYNCQATVSPDFSITTSEDGTRSIVSFPATFGKQSDGSAGPATSAIRFEIPADRTAQFTDWFEGGAANLASAQLVALPTDEGDALYSALARLSDCAVERLTVADRIRYLRFVTEEEWITNLWQEELIVRLLTVVPDDQLGGLYDALAGYGSYRSLLTSVDDPQQISALIGRLMSIHQARHPEFAVGHPGQREAVERVETLIDFNSWESGGWNHRGNPLKVSYPDSKIAFTAEQSGGVMLGSGPLPSTYTSLATVGPMEPVLVYVGPGQENLGLKQRQYLGVLPGAAVALLAEKRLAEMQEREAMLTVDVALLATGVGELTAAYKAYQVGKTALALARFGVAVADNAAAMTDIACKGSDAELCKDWQQISGYVALGLLSSSAADGVGSLLARSDGLVVRSIRYTLAEQASLAKLKKHNLINNVGGASEKHVANVHLYTVNGDYLNTPMRNPITNSMDVPDVKLAASDFESYRKIVDGLAALRLTDRLETGIVMRGRTVSIEDYERLFGLGSPNEIPVKGFVSATRDWKVAEAFAADANFPGEKVRMIWNITSKHGVDIDDISDWGSTLGPIHHSDKPEIMVQREVLMEEGYFKKTSEPRKIIENGVHKQDRQGNFWYEIALEELGTPIREMNR